MDVPTHDKDGNLLDYEKSNAFIDYDRRVLEHRDEHDFMSGRILWWLLAGLAVIECFICYLFYWVTRARA